MDLNPLQEETYGNRVAERVGFEPGAATAAERLFYGEERGEPSSPLRGVRESRWPPSLDRGAKLSSGLLCLKDLLGGHVLGDGIALLPGGLMPLCGCEV